MPTSSKDSELKAADYKLIAARSLVTVLMVAGAIMLLSYPAKAFHTANPDNTRTSRPDLREIATYVANHGWTVNLGAVCKGLLLLNRAGQCRYRQIAVNAKSQKGDEHGFNVPLDNAASNDYLLYHVTPVTGEFVIVSNAGKPISATFRERGKDFERMSKIDAQSFARTEIAFWRQHFTAIKRSTAPQ